MKGWRPEQLGGFLTEREAEVLALVLQGKTDREIEQVLWLSDKSIETHKRALHKKLGVGERHLSLWLLRQAYRDLLVLEAKWALLGMSAEKAARR